MRSKPSRNESKWIEMNRIAWLRVALSIGFTFFVLWPCGANGVCKWRSFQKPLKKHAEPGEGLQNAISNHFRALWHARDSGIINQSMEICIRFIWHMYIPYIYIGYIHIWQHTLQSYREARLEIAFWFDIKKDGSTLGS